MSLSLSSSPSDTHTIYIYIYMCVCVCVYGWFKSQLMQIEADEAFMTALIIIQSVSWYGF